VSAPPPSCQGQQQCAPTPAQPSTSPLPSPHEPRQPDGADTSDAPLPVQPFAFLREGEPGTHAEHCTVCPCGAVANGISALRARQCFVAHIQMPTDAGGHGGEIEIDEPTLRRLAIVRCRHCNVLLPNLVDKHEMVECTAPGAPRMSVREFKEQQARLDPNDRLTAQPVARPYSLADKRAPSHSQPWFRGCPSRSWPSILAQASHEI